MLILERRLRDRAVLRGTGRRRHARPARPARRATRGRHQVVADLARDVRFHYFDEPVLKRCCRATYVRRGEALDALAADPGRPARGEPSTPVVGCPQPLRGPCCAAGWRPGIRSSGASSSRSTHAGFYRTRELRGLRFDGRGRHLLCAADYDWDSKHIHLVVAYAPLEPYLACSPAMAPTSGTADPARDGRRRRGHLAQGGQPAADVTAAEFAALLAACDFGSRTLHRLDITVTSIDGSGRAPAHPARHVPAAARRRPRRGSALPQPAPDAGQAARAVAAGQLRAGAAPVGRGRLPLPRGRARATPRTTACSRWPRCATSRSCPDAAGVADLSLAGADGPAGAGRDAAGAGRVRPTGPPRGEPDRALRAAALAQCRGRPGRRWPESLVPLAAGVGLEKAVLRVAHPGARRSAARLGPAR